jgi:hypothetical protein
MNHIHYVNVAIFTTHSSTHFCILRCLHIVKNQNRHLNATCNTHYTLYPCIVSNCAMKRNILTARSRIVLVKPVIAYRVLKFSAFYGNRRCTRAHNRPLFLTRRSQSVPSLPVSVSHISQTTIDDYVFKIFLLRRFLWKIFCKHILVLLCVSNASLTVLSGTWTPQYLTKGTLHNYWYNLSSATCYSLPLGPHGDPVSQVHKRTD